MSETLSGGGESGGDTESGGDAESGSDAGGGSDTSGGDDAGTGGDTEDGGGAEGGSDAGIGVTETFASGAGNLMESVPPQSLAVIPPLVLPVPPTPLPPPTPMVMLNYTHSGAPISVAVSSWSPGPFTFTYSTGDTAYYSFELDLISGAITNAETHGNIAAMSSYGTTSWSLTGGSGNWGLGVITGFSAGAGGPGFFNGSPLTAGATKMPLLTIPIPAVGDPVSAGIYLENTASQDIDFILPTGSRVQ
jgi:hypothetical protein